MSSLRHARRSPVLLQHHQHTRLYCLSQCSTDDSLLIMCDWKSGILMIGETPHAAMAGTASCIAASAPHVNSQTLQLACGDAPSMLPCSQSTMIQSGFALASALDTLAPGNICYLCRQHSVDI